MSSYTRIDTVNVNLDRYMSMELGNELGLDEKERNSFSDFHKLSEHEDYLFLWACAQMVADEMALGNPEVVLTQYGITEKNYLNRTVVVEAAEETVIKQRIMALNRKFINLWTAKVVEMKAQRDKINSLTAETRNLLDKNIYAVDAIRRVVEMMIADGFSPTDPNVINTPVSQAYSKGVHIAAENDLKEKREVWLFLAGGKTKVHVNTKNPLDCTRTAREVAIKVAEILKNIGRASIPVSTSLEGTILDGAGTKPGGKNEQQLVDLQRTPAPAKLKT